MKEEYKPLDGYRVYQITDEYPIDEQKALIIRAGNVQLQAEELVMECTKLFEPGEEKWMRKAKVDRAMRALMEAKTALTEAQKIVDTDFVAMNKKRSRG